MNIEQRALQDGSSVVGHDNDGPTYRILHNSTSKRSEVSCCEKNNPPRSMVQIIVRINEGRIKSSDDLENEYQGIQNVETTRTTGLDNVGENNAVKKQDDTLTLRFTEKISRDIMLRKSPVAFLQSTLRNIYVVLG